MPKWRVRHSVTLPGYSENGQRLQILPYKTEGRQIVNYWYDVEKCTHSFPSGGAPEPALRFVGANHSAGNGDLFVRLSEFQDLADFPNVAGDKPILIPE